MASSSVYYHGADGSVVREPTRAGVYWAVDSRPFYVAPGPPASLRIQPDDWLESGHIILQVVDQHDNDVLASGRARMILSDGQDTVILAEKAVVCGLADFSETEIKGSPGVDYGLYFEATLGDCRLESDLRAFTMRQPQQTKSKVLETMLEHEALTPAELDHRLRVAREAADDLTRAARDAERRADAAETRAQQLACAGQLQTRGSERRDVQKWLRNAIDAHIETITTLEDELQGLDKQQIDEIDDKTDDAEERRRFTNSRPDMDMLCQMPEDLEAELEILETMINERCLGFLEEGNNDSVDDIIAAMKELVEREVGRLEALIPEVTASYRYLKMRCRFLDALVINPNDDDAVPPLHRQKRALRAALAEFNATASNNVVEDFPLPLENRIDMPEWGTLIFEDPYTVAVFVDFLAKRFPLAVQRNDTLTVVVRLSGTFDLTFLPADVHRINLTIDKLRHRYRRWTTTSDNTT